MSLVSINTEHDWEEKMKVRRERDSALDALRMIKEILGPSPDCGADEPRYLGYNLACDELEKYAKADETARVNR